MNYILKNGYVFRKNRFVSGDVFVSDGIIADISPRGFSGDTAVIPFDGCFIIPGLADVHVHLREPGFFYKESIKTGTLAAARGGYTAVCAMPNLSPVPDCMENLKEELSIIERDAAVRVLPYGAITRAQAGAELSDMEKMAPYVAAFSDDGRGVQSDGIMLAALKKSKSLGKIIAAHCEDNSLLKGGYIHDGEYARKNGHRGICSESEWKQVGRDIELARQTGCPYHVCHVSAKESVELIRKAKADGIDITCETAPHYLVLTENELKDDGRFKMNPPLRSESDRRALIEGIKDGTIDMIATDHAPHSAEEKSRGLKLSSMGVVGLECAFPVLYTELVKNNIITLEKLIELMSLSPKRRFNIPGGLEIGESADLAVFDLRQQYKINPDEFLSKGRSTPFEGKEVFGKCIMTMVNGRIVWQENSTEK